MFHYLQNGSMPLMAGIKGKASSAAFLLLNKMRTLGLAEDALCALDGDQCNALHRAAENDMGDTIKALLNGEKKHVKAALAAQDAVMSRTAIVANQATVCARGQQVAAPARVFQRVLQ